MDRFTPIDVKTWPRKALYELYNKSWMEASFSATMRVKVENLVKYQKERGQKFVPALLYIFTKELSGDPAFTLAVQDGQVGHWERLHPMYPVLNENGTFTFHYTPVEGDFRSFYDAYLREKEESAGRIGAYASGNMPFNSYCISIMNYFPFDSFSFSMKNNKNYYAPVIFIGKYGEDCLMPVSVTVNHAACDGFHVSELFRRLQEAFDHPEKWLAD